MERLLFIFLLIIIICSAIIAHLSYKLGHEHGRVSVYQEWTSDGTEGTPYTK